MKLRNALILLVVALAGLLAFYIKDGQKKIEKTKDYRAQLDSCRASMYKNFDKTELATKAKFIADMLPVYDHLLGKTDASFYLNAQKIPSANEKVKFCIIVASYNNVKYATQNLNSIFMQDYHNWRMIYMDDASNDGMSELVEKIKQESKLPDDKFTINRYKERMRKASYSFYYAANNFCKDEEVMLFVDGDDMLSTPKVLDRLAYAYDDGKTWLTYGHLMHISSGELCPITREANCCEWNDIRGSAWWGYSHLRTSYTWLFKKIKPEDLQYKGEFLTSSWDMGIMYPMLEMAGKDRSKYISDITYLYRSHAANDSKLFSKEQKELENHVRGLTPYKLLENSY